MFLPSCCKDENSHSSGLLHSQRHSKSFQFFEWLPELTGRHTTVRVCSNQQGSQKPNNKSVMNILTHSKWHGQSTLVCFRNCNVASKRRQWYLLRWLWVEFQARFWKQRFINYVRPFLMMKWNVNCPKRPLLKLAPFIPQLSSSCRKLVLRQWGNEKGGKVKMLLDPPHLPSRLPPPSCSHLSPLCSP